MSQFFDINSRPDPDELIIQIADYVMDYEIKSDCLLYTSPSPRDAHESRMPSSA